MSADLKNTMRLLFVLALVLFLGGQNIQGAEPFSVSGDSAIKTNAYSDFLYSAQAEQARFSEIRVKNQSFEWATQVQIKSQTPHPWDVQIQSSASNLALKKGEQVLLILWARCTQAPDDTGLFGVLVQSTGSPWRGILSSELSVGKNWRKFYFYDKAIKDFSLGGYEISLHLGMQEQTLEIGGIELFRVAPEEDLSKLPPNRVDYVGQESDAKWRKEAQERIEKYRKADLKILLKNSHNKAVVGATVHLEMLRHAYGFGTFLESDAMTEGPERKKLQEWTLKLFNRVTTPIYWADWGWANRGVRKKYLACAEWAAKNNLAIRGHCVVYPGWEFMPSFMRKYKNDPVALQKRILEQVIEVTEATRPFAFTEYDVCNELRSLTEIPDKVGKKGVAEWFGVTRKHAPSSLMAINENAILTRSGAGLAEQKNHEDWISYLESQGQGPDVIGMQGHFCDALSSPEKVIQILDRFAKFKKPIQITEFDFSTRDEDGQARYTRDFMTAVFSHPSTNAFTMWGFWEGKIWRKSAGMIRTDWSLKPNGEMYMDLVFKQWWTELLLKTDDQGQCLARGFLGQYRVSVTKGAQVITKNFDLSSTGSQIELVLD